MGAYLDRVLALTSVRGYMREMRGREEQVHPYVNSLRAKLAEPTRSPLEPKSWNLLSTQGREAMWKTPLGVRGEVTEHLRQADQALRLGDRGTAITHLSQAIARSSDPQVQSDLHAHVLGLTSKPPKPDPGDFWQRHPARGDFGPTGAALRRLGQSRAQRDSAQRFLEQANTPSEAQLRNLRGG